MSIFIKNTVPFLLLALIVLGCDQGKKVHPVASQYEQPTWPSPEELEQQKKAVVEAHNKFVSVLHPYTSDIEANISVRSETAKGTHMTKAEAFLNQLDLLDASSCPDDYRKVHDALKDAWVEFGNLIVKNQGDWKITPGPVPLASVGSFGNNFDDSYRVLLRFNDPEYKETVVKVKEKTKEFEPVAKRYGLYHF